MPRYIISFNRSGMFDPEVDLRRKCENLLDTYFACGMQEELRYPASELMILAINQLRADYSLSNKYLRRRPNAATNTNVIRELKRYKLSLEKSLGALKNLSKHSSITLMLAWTSLPALLTEQGLPTASNIDARAERKRVIKAAFQLEKFFGFNEQIEFNLRILNAAIAATSLPPHKPKRHDLYRFLRALGIVWYLLTESYPNSSQKNLQFGSFSRECLQLAVIKGVVLKDEEIALANVLRTMIRAGDIRKTIDLLEAP